MFAQACFVRILRGLTANHSICCIMEKRLYCFDFFIYQAITSRAADTVLQVEPWLNISTSCSLPEPWDSKPLARPNPDYITFRWNISRSVSHYVGIYSHKGFGNLTVYAEDNSSMFLLFGRFGKMHLQPTSDTHFAGYYVDKLWFFTGSDEHTNPIRMQFIIDKNTNVVTGVLFPVDFGGPLTLFQTDVYYDWNSASNSLCISGINAATYIPVLTYHMLLTVVAIVHFQV